MIYVFNGYELDCETHELRLEGAVTPVEPRVFTLLAFLIANRHRMVAKEEVLTALWGDRIVSDAALSSQIKSARRAIGDDGKTQTLIRTIHGRGFRFVGEVSQRYPETDAATSVAMEPASSSSAGEQSIQFCSAPDGVRIAYASVGEGPVLVKTANWLSHLEYDWESPVWRHWIRGLSQRRQLIRYDERGNGMSDRQVSDLSFDAMVADLESVVDATGLDTFPLFGISQGCAVAVEYAARHPQRVRGLVLYGGFVQGWRKRNQPSEIEWREAATVLMRNGWGQDNPAFRQIFTQRFVPGGSPPQMRWFDELQRKTVSPENAARFHEVFGQIDVTPRLAQITHPTLVLHARDDQEIALAHGRAFATGIAGARFVTLDSRNHILLEDEPAFARFLREVNQFLSGLD